MKDILVNLDALYGKFGPAPGVEKSVQRGAK